MARLLKTNTAVRITVGPFLDVGDGKTPETGMTVTNITCELFYDKDEGSATTRAALTLSASGGNNDMVHITDDTCGMYDLELTAANVNFYGRMILTFHDDDVHLPVWHEFMVVHADYFNIACSTKLGAPAGASINADIAAVKAETALIVADTNELQTDDTPGALSTLSGKVDTVDGIVDDILVDTAVIGALGAGLTALSTQASVDAIKAETALIVADTNELQTDDTPGAISTLSGKVDTIDGIVDDILVDTAVIGALGAGLTGIPWNAAWDAEVQSEVFDALDTAFTDATELTANGLLDRIRTLQWILRNKIEVTDANGNTVIYKDDSSTPAFSVNAMLTDDSTTTTRLRAA